MIPRIIETIEVDGSEIIQSRYLDQFKHLNKELEGFVRLIGSTIDLRTTERHEYVVVGGFDSLFSEIEIKKKENENAIDEICNRLNQEMCNKIKLEKNEINGHFLRISYQHKRM